MDSSLGQALLAVFQVLLVISVVAGIGAGVLLLLTYRDIRRLNIPDDAGFFGAMRVVPIRVAIFLDLMDLALDTFAAPAAWLLLHWLRLDQLKAPAMIEALIPGTQFIPTMTILWAATRVFNLGELPTPTAAPAYATESTAGVRIIDGRVVAR